jgi:Fic family protein
MKAMKFPRRWQKIVNILLEKGSLASSGIHAELSDTGESISLVTVKRTLSEMVAREALASVGSGRSVSYVLTTEGRLFADVDARKYCAEEPDKRFGMKRYNFELFDAIPSEIFSVAELQRLEKFTAEYRQRTKNLPPAIQKRELERLIIELSWKSSKIEGNTYTLLDTEKLILNNEKASGHDRDEARMILNHKDAFIFIREHASRFRSLSRANIEQIHKILVKGLSIGAGLRKKPVGITGSLYNPLDNAHQLAEGVERLGKAISKIDSPYAKALVALLGISYLQPFEDGNKRTARMTANAILLAHAYAPLSYRSVDENDYRSATIVFYEINSMVPFKNIFIEQYEFAAKNYGVR